MKSFKERSGEEELMDDLDCKGEVVEQTLRELDIINRRLGGNYVSIQALKELLANQPRDREFTVSDLGCGGGDILIYMADWARKNNFRLKFIGIDANPNIIAYAENHCKDYPEISFRSLDIFSKEFKDLSCDIVHSSLFTHHFNEEELVRLFKNVSESTQIGMIINDLHRHWLAYYSIKWITRLFSRSEMVRNDAAVSVARGFKKKDLKAIFRKVQLTDYKISWRWAFRWKVAVRFTSP